MTDYSFEPPRANCVVHHTFTNTPISDQRVVDVSPQNTDGSLVPPVSFGHTGVVGTAAKLDDNQQNITVDADTQYYDAPSTTLSAWAKSDVAVPSAQTNVTATINIGGKTYTLSHTVASDVDEWQFAALDFIGDEARLYYGTKDSKPVVVEEVFDAREVRDASLEFTVEKDGFVDDVRQYRRSIGQDNVLNLYKIGAVHETTDEIGELWDNNGIPYFAENRRLAGTLGEGAESTWRQLDYLREARHINDAAGEQLDRIGALAGIARRENEGDAKYRARIKGTIIAGRSDGTFDDIIDGTAAILETDSNRVRATTNFSTDPATAFVTVRTSDIADSDLTPADLTQILKDVVLAGHDIEIQAQTQNAFTIRNDAQANDPALGLTSDSTADGGELIEDI